MAPIRVGLIGLSSVNTGGIRAGEWGLQHLLSIQSSPHFELVAVCNSTLESAQRAIEFHKIPSTVKPYGSAEEIARDPNVDLVSVVVHVDKHYDLVKPVLQQKKNILIEFPATPSVTLTAELAALARDAGVLAVIGSQGRSDPAIRKLKELVDDKVVGDLVSSTSMGHIPMVVSEHWPQWQSGFLDFDSSISRNNIVLGHVLDCFISVLGSFETVQAVFKTQEKTAKLVDDEGNVVDPNYRVTSAGTMLIQGVVEGGAAASVQLRSSTSSVDGFGQRWIISGTEGEIIFTGGPGFLNFGLPGQKIMVKKWSEEPEEVSFACEESEHYGETGLMSKNTLRLYDAIAKGETDAYATIEQSLQTQELIEIIKSSVTGIL
ncbi:hypothetical protein B0J13DRAFT_504827 [Dactylonectria estremocensis]|uniref:Gfo/Idh/MocA-like oxidoreductase N-terminal domain-containing protein n=1 Tax=Dactylonectria estremocensis TaxID=1079267 RepID=A0A9P9EKQ4_9HYPO|nr:hypothetical protein B0J13DRAFT_504827 [Dactylonectria estremocensis]